MPACTSTAGTGAATPATDGRDGLLGNVDSQRRDAAHLNAQANAYCERLIGTVRRECLDFMIPLHERQLRGTLRSWVARYNKGRPHSSLGPGTPEPTPTQHPSQLYPRHRLPRDCRITVEDIWGGLHHECQPEKVCRLMLHEVSAEHSPPRLAPA
jgi:hypothetical protein